jgi:hypothetical protein
MQNANTCTPQSCGSGCFSVSAAVLLALGGVLWVGIWMIDWLSTKQHVDSVARVQDQAVLTKQHNSIACTS